MAKHKKGKKYKGYREDLAGGKIITDNGEIYFKQIYGYLLSQDELIIVGEVKKQIERTGKYPTIEKLVKTFIIRRFFPRLLAPLYAADFQTPMSVIEEQLVPAMIARIFGEARGGYDKAKEFIAHYTSYVPVLIASCELTSGDDKKLRHVCDYRYYSESNARTLLESIIDNDSFRDEFEDVISKGLVQLFTRITEVTEDEFHQLADWYLKDLGLYRTPGKGRLFLGYLNELASGDEGMKEFALDFYEAHSDSLTPMLAANPDLDFIIQGKSVRYDSIAEYAKEHGETEDFFIEEVGSESVPHTLREKRKAGKKARAEYHLKVVEAMDIIFKAVQAYSTECHVLNFEPNAIKDGKKPRNEYLSIAFKCDGQWCILVDSVKPGNAVYLWRGERYADGLEIFKMAKTYAREQPGVKRKYHRKEYEFAQIYQAILQT